MLEKKAKGGIGTLVGGALGAGLGGLSGLTYSDEDGLRNALIGVVAGGLLGAGIGKGISTSLSGKSVIHQFGPIRGGGSTRFRSERARRRVKDIFEEASKAHREARQRAYAAGPKYTRAQTRAQDAAYAQATKQKAYEAAQRARRRAAEEARKQAEKVREEASRAYYRSYRREAGGFSYRRPAVVPGWLKNVKTKKDAKEIFRTLAKKNHPDADGSLEAIKTINMEWTKFKKSPAFEKLSSPFFDELRCILGAYHA